jgi:hypothetical protein
MVLRWPCRPDHRFARDVTVLHRAGPAFPIWSQRGLASGVTGGFRGRRGDTIRKADTIRKRERSIVAPEFLQCLAVHVSEAHCGRPGPQG